LFKLRKSHPPISEICAPRSSPEKNMRDNFQCLSNNGPGIPVGSPALAWLLLNLLERSQQALGGQIKAVTQ
jgi:hypothetical protein